MAPYRKFVRDSGEFGAVDDGTMCRMPSPRPGPIRDEDIGMASLKEPGFIGKVREADIELSLCPEDDGEESDFFVEPEPRVPETTRQVIERPLTAKTR